MLRLEHSLPTGINIRIDSLADWAIYNDIFVSTEYDIAIRRALNGCNGCCRVLDLGANVGSVTKSIPKIGKPVFAYEPDPVPFEELNKIIDSNLKTHLAAAWTSDGCIELFHHHDWEN
jgi:hypothetical protein